MLPASTGERTQRAVSRGRADGRTVEIQRLIGPRAPLRVRLRGARRAHALARLRRPAGGRRHALRVDHRRVDRRSPRPRPLRALEGASRLGRGRLGRDRRRRAGPRPRLPGGLVGRDGHERRHDRRGGAWSRCRRPPSAIRSRAISSISCSTSRQAASRSSTVAQRRRRSTLRAREAPVLASRNENKLRELRRALPEWEIELLGAPGRAGRGRRHFLGNARIKARHGRLHAQPRELGRRRGLGDRGGRARRSAGGRVGALGRRRCHAPARRARRRGGPTRALRLRAGRRSAPTARRSSHRHARGRDRR